jgi:anti-sigma regulatory factor (Ser/Thr protein kinase)
MVDEVLRSDGDAPSHALLDDPVGYGSTATPWCFEARHIPQNLVGHWTDVVALTAGRTGVLLGCCPPEDRCAGIEVLRSQARAELMRTADPVRTLSSLVNSPMSALCAVMEGDTMTFSILGQSSAALSSAGMAPFALSAGAGRYSVSPLAAGTTVLMSSGPIRSAGTLLGDSTGVHLDQLADRVIQGLASDSGAAAVLYRHPPEPLSITMPSDPSSLAVSRGLLRDWLSAAGLGTEAAADVLLAVGEATANSTEHAVVGSPGPVEITLTVQFSESALRLTISDNGCWKPADDSPGHRGHGLLLMRALVDAVDVTTSPRGTTVTMVKELPR